MITFPRGGRLIEHAHELPVVPDMIETLFADAETSSGDPKKTSLDPWRDCTIIGMAVAFDDGSPLFVPRDLLLTGWWADVMRATKRWVNQNIKYDAHVSMNDLGVAPCRQLVDTLTGSKLIDSDRLTRSLDVLSRDWCGYEIEDYEWRMQPYLHRNKDYGQIPVDILAEYATDGDIIATQKLIAHIEREMPAESAFVWATEQRITHLLWEMEQEGIRIDPTQLQMKQLEVLMRLSMLDEKLAQLAGRPFRAHVTDDCYDILCGQYGLPVLAFTKKELKEDGTFSGGGPSFDKDALKMYLGHPAAPRELVRTMLEYRTLNTFNSLFLNTYSEKHIDGVMHPNYNQMVRTGRMSCSQPNMQQLSGLAKELIIPPEGHAIVTADSSQLEFRLLGAYTGNARVLAAYNKDPWTDFHQLVADSAGTKRKPAKTINFAMGYGQGKKSTVALLSLNEDIVEEAEREVIANDIDEDYRPQAIAELCKQRALSLYAWYHRDMLPELKDTASTAGSVARRRGYARNWYGRHRHLPSERAHIALNTLCQSTAGDYFKERMVALRDEVPWFKQVTQVHDNVLGYVPLEMLTESTEREQQTLRAICDVMNDARPPTRPFPVPFRTAIGWSERNWKDAGEREQKPR